jgi:tetratricopeptide (TPR) repeat protein
VLLISASAQQTADEWIELGNDLNAFEYIDVERNAEAVKAFDRAIDIDPTNKEAWSGLRVALRRIAVYTYDKEDLRQSDNVDTLYAHGTNLSDPRSIPALEDHANRTAYDARDPEFKYATERDVAEALEGTPYFNTSDKFVNSFGPYDINLNMTSNTSDSNRAAGLVFEALFKHPRVNEVEITCYETVWDWAGEATSLLHIYTMARADADGIDDWSNLDLSHYDMMEQSMIPPDIDQRANQALERFGVTGPSRSQPSWS